MAAVEVCSTMGLRSSFISLSLLLPLVHAFKKNYLSVEVRKGHQMLPISLNVTVLGTSDESVLITMELGVPDHNPLSLSLSLTSIPLLSVLKLSEAVRVLLVLRGDKERFSLLKNEKGKGKGKESQRKLQKHLQTLSRSSHFW